MGTVPGTAETKVEGTWTFLNAFLTDVNFGSHSYDSEDMVEVVMTVQYDWAEYRLGDDIASGT